MKNNQYIMTPLTDKQQQLLSLMWYYKSMMKLDPDDEKELIIQFKEIDVKKGMSDRLFLNRMRREYINKVSIPFKETIKSWRSSIG